MENEKYELGHLMTSEMVKVLILKGFQGYRVFLLRFADIIEGYYSRNLKQLSIL